MMSRIKLLVLNSEEVLVTLLIIIYEGCKGSKGFLRLNSSLISMILMRMIFEVYYMVVILDFFPTQK